MEVLGVQTIVTIGALTDDLTLSTLLLTGLFPFDFLSAEVEGSIDLEILLVALDLVSDNGEPPGAFTRAEDA